MNQQTAITRQKKGKRFVYSQAGQTVTDQAVLDRITSLVIPPAWRDVKIAASSRAKIQATGFDGNGKQQYIYHPSFRARQEKLKFDRILHFATALPALRRQLQTDLKRKRLNKDKVLACIVTLMDEAYFRVGNERYAKQNQSYGITTMRSKHTQVKGDTVTFDFQGKSGVEHVKQITHSQIARIIKKLDELPGYEIFRYQDHKGQMHGINSSDVNAYIKQHMGEEFSAKDFRTWGGTLLATTEIIAAEQASSEKERKKIITNVVKNVAEQLGNTPAIARASYIDPRVFDTYIQPTKLSRLKRAMEKMRPKKYLSRDEQCVLQLLQAT